MRAGVILAQELYMRGILTGLSTGRVGHSQYQTTMTPLPPCPNSSVPPPAATEMLIRRSRPTSVANAVASRQSSSHDFVVLSKMRWRTVIVFLRAAVPWKRIGRV